METTTRVSEHSTDGMGTDAMSAPSAVPRDTHGDGLATLPAQWRGRRRAYPVAQRMVQTSHPFPCHLLSAHSRASSSPSLTSPPSKLALLAYVGAAGLDGQGAGAGVDVHDGARHLGRLVRGQVEHGIRGVLRRLMASQG